MWLIIYFLFAHWIADFVLQTREDATNKSSSVKHLLNHVSTYTFIMTIALIIIMFTLWINTLFIMLLLFILIQFTSHFCIDYITSKLNKKLWDNQMYHMFFASIGFDQFLHVVILILNLELIK